MAHCWLNTLRRSTSSTHVRSLAPSWLQTAFSTIPSLSQVSAGIGSSSQRLPILTGYALVRAKRLLKQRLHTQGKVQKHANLKVFKREAKTGVHDLHLPLYQWSSVLLNNTLTQGATEQLRGSIFNRPVSNILLHQVVRWQRAKRRQPLAFAKTKAEVRGGGRKPHPQKGTGRARQGSIRSPHMKGGGVVFGPRPRSFAFKLPKKIRRAGLMSALSSKTQQQQLLLIDSFTLSPEEEEACVKAKASKLVTYIKDIDSHFPPHRRARDQFYEAIDGDTSLIVDEDTNETFSDDIVVENIMNRLKSNGSNLMTLYMSTGTFRENVYKLLPEATPDKRLVAAQQILSSLNALTPPPSPALACNDPNKRKERILIIHGDAGDDCGPVTVSSATQKGVRCLSQHTMVRRFSGNIPTVNCLPARGANVLDILRHQYLIITQAGLRDLTTRLTTPLYRGFKWKGYSLEGLKEKRAEQIRLEQLRRAKLGEWISLKSPQVE